MAYSHAMGLRDPQGILLFTPPPTVLGISYETPEACLEDLSPPDRLMQME